MPAAHLFTEAEFILMCILAKQAMDSLLMDFWSPYIMDPASTSCEKYTCTWWHDSFIDI